MSNENSNPDSFAFETAEENEMKLRLEPYQEQRILQFMDNGQEKVIEELTDEEQFAVFLKKLDFSEIANSTQYSSLDQLQKEIAPKIPKKSENLQQVESTVLTATINKMSESLGHMENLLMFLRDFTSKDNKKFLLDSANPRETRTLTPSESFKLFSLKQKQLQETADLLKKGLKNIRSRIESNRVYNEQVFEIQKNWKTKIIQPSQQNSFQKLEVDLSVGDGMLQKFRKKYALGFRNPFPSSATQLEIVLPPIKGLDDFQTLEKIKKYFSKKAKESKKNLQEENNFDKKKFKNNSKILEMVQTSMFNSELFEFLKKSMNNSPKMISCIENERIEFEIFPGFILICELLKKDLFWDTQFHLEEIDPNGKENNLENRIIAPKTIKIFFEDALLRIYEFWKEISFFQKKNGSLKFPTESQKDSETATWLYSFKCFDAILMNLEELIKNHLKI